MKYTHPYIVLLVGLVLMMAQIACQDDSTEPASLEVDAPNLDFGEVNAGSSASASLTFKGSNISGFLDLVVSGQGFSLDKNEILIPNIDRQIIVTFAPDENANLGAVSGMLTVTGDEVSLSIPLNATVTEVPGLPAGTVVYRNDFEFGLDQNTKLASTDFEATDSLGDGLVPVYNLVFLNPSSSTANIRTQARHGLCRADTTAGNDGECGSGFQIVGANSSGNTSLTVSLSGLEPDRSYKVIYFVRPNGSSLRSMNVVLSGDLASAEEVYDGADNDFYLAKERNGASDASGNLSLKFEYTASSTSRSITIDGLEVQAL